MRGSDARSRVLIVDTTPIIRRGLLSLINDQRDLETCGECDSAHVAIATIEKLEPNLVLIDLSVTGDPGIELGAEIHRRWPNVYWIIFSASQELLFAERVVRAGGGGYVTKTTDLTSLLDAMRKVLAGEICLSERASTQLLRTLAGKRQDDDRSALAHLSNRELDVFLLVGQGLRVSEIADRLSVSPRTIDAHKAHIKRKLQMDSNRDLLKAAIALRNDRSLG